MNIKSANIAYTPYEVFHLLPDGDYPGTLSSSTIVLDKRNIALTASDHSYALALGVFTLECDLAIRGTARVILRVTPTFLIVLDEQGNSL